MSRGSHFSGRSATDILTPSGLKTLKITPCKSGLVQYHKLFIWCVLKTFWITTTNIGLNKCQSSTFYTDQRLRNYFCIQFYHRGCVSSNCEQTDNLWEMFCICEESFFMSLSWYSQKDFHFDSDRNIFWVATVGFDGRDRVGAVAAPSNSEQLIIPAETYLFIWKWRNQRGEFLADIALRGQDWPTE